MKLRDKVLKSPVVMALSALAISGIAVFDSNTKSEEMRAKIRDILVGSSLPNIEECGQLSPAADQIVGLLPEAQRKGAAENIRANIEGSLRQTMGMQLTDTEAEQLSAAQKNLYQTLIDQAYGGGQTVNVELTGAIREYEVIASACGRKIEEVLAKSERKVAMN